MGIWILANKVSTTHPYLPPNSTTRTPPTHTQEFTDEQGNIIWANYDYAWGGRYTHFYKEQSLNNVSIDKDHLQPLRFQGQFFDTETSLHYNRFRYYDSDVGMFIGRDPIGLLGGVNVFAYAPNPIHWVDPFGLCVQPALKKARNQHNSKTVKEMADDLHKLINQNSVTYQTPTRMGHIDIAGKEHFDKKTNTNYPIPHVQESPININPKTGEKNPLKKQEAVRNATKSDIRIARKLAKQKGLIK